MSHRLPCHPCHRLQHHRSPGRRRDRHPRPDRRVVAAGQQAPARAAGSGSGEPSIAFAIAGRNTGHLHAGGEHDCDGSEFFLTDLSASGPLNGRGLGKPDGNSRRVAWRMLRSEDIDCMIERPRQIASRRVVKSQFNGSGGQRAYLASSQLVRRRAMNINLTGNVDLAGNQSARQQARPRNNGAGAGHQIAVVV